MLRCTILDDYQQVALACADWSGLGKEVGVEAIIEPIADRDRLAERLAAVDIVVAMRERTRFDRGLFERLPALRLLVTTGMRNASIDLVAANERGITVCGTGSHPGPAAELTWALILSLAREIPREAEAVRRGGWQTTLGRSMHGTTLGIVGVGKIGTQMASVGRAFGMNVIGWSRSLTPERAASLGIGRCATLDALLRAADIVTVHLTLAPETRGLIGANELAAMKRDALLINTSRGPIIDERALLAALDQRRIAGAALDVYDREPLPPDHPLRTHPKVLATPHLGYVTRENYAAFYGDAVDDIRHWLAGTPVRLLSKAHA